jgi:hypothetical protein
LRPVAALHSGRGIVLAAVPRAFFGGAVRPLHPATNRLLRTVDATIDRFTRSPQRFARFIGSDPPGLSGHGFGSLLGAVAASEATRQRGAKRDKTDSTSVMHDAHS